MSMRLTNAAASAAAGDGSDAGLRAYIGATPKLIFYTGSVNGNAELAPAGTVLGTVTLAAFGAASSGAIASTGGTAAAGNSGSATCWALFKSDGTTKVADGTAGAGSGDLSFDSNTIVSGGTITVGTVTLTVPPA